MDKALTKIRNMFLKDTQLLCGCVYGDGFLFGNKRIRHRACFYIRPLTGNKSAAVYTDVGSYMVKVALFYGKEVQEVNALASIDDIFGYITGYMGR